MPGWRRRIGAMALIAAGAAVAWAGQAAKVVVEVPPEIKRALDREVGGGRILGLSSGQDDDKNLIYIAHAQIEGWAYTIRFDLDGSLIDNECDEPDPDAVKISPEDIPAIVADRLRAETGGAPYADPTRQDNQSIYQVQSHFGGHTYNIRVDGDGKLLSKERDDDDADQDKKPT
jgi:hypothetical protein